jgi:hypothetical protein
MLLQHFLPLFLARLLLAAPLARFLECHPAFARHLRE